MEGAFDAAVRANVEKDSQLASLREQLAFASARQPTQEEAHVLAADAAEISRLRAQVAALQSTTEGAGSHQLSASPAPASSGQPIIQVEQVSAESGPTLQQLAADWLCGEAPAEEPHARLPPTDASISASANDMMPGTLHDAFIPTSGTETSVKRPSPLQNCTLAVQVQLHCTQCTW